MKRTASYFRIKELTEQNEVLRDNAILFFEGKHPKGGYVTIRAFNRQKELTEHFIALYHELKDKYKNTKHIS